MCCDKCNSQTVEDSDFSPEDCVTSSQEVFNMDVAKAKTPFFKKWWVLTIGGVTLILGIAAVLSYRKDKRLYQSILDLIVSNLRG
ncbi:MAG: hypothetical protein QMB62_00380 [Oscillospiraceae bacterium]